MKINFNVVRKKAILSYNDLVKKLNGSLVEDTDYIRVIVPVQDIQRSLNNLRDALVSIGCTYEENDPDFQCILNDNDKVLEFNPEGIASKTHAISKAKDLLRGEIPK